MMQAPAQQRASAVEYLYLWTASADSSQPDFLAVLDVTEQSGRYGRLVTTLPVPGLQNRPRLAAQFGDVDGFAHPHSFLRLPGGHVLATFQMRHEGEGMAPGGLVELTADGRPVRSSSANAPGLDPATRVYSAGVVPALDRIVTTTTDMDGRSPASRQLQIWRLSDLSLLHMITLPNGPAGDESMMTAEPRVLDDGRTVLVSTITW
jgi:hypothetical protein